MDIGKTLKFARLKNGVAAGQTDITSDFIDISGYAGALLVVLPGSITAGGTFEVTVLQSASSDGSSPDTLAGSTKTYADTNDNKPVVYDLFRPTKRYVGVAVNRGTQDAVLDGILAILYKGKVAPSVDDTTILDKITLISPAAA